MLKYRQGDVGLEPLAETPEGLEFKPVKSAILAEGEKTGHAHTLTATLEMENGEYPLLMAEKDGVMYLKIAEPLPLKHQEHSTITIAPGTYKVARQVEYTPEAPRQVLD